MRKIFLDTETTGFEPREGHRVIEIGMVEVTERRISEKNFHFLINPERTIGEDSIEVHGITNEDVADKPLFKDVYEAMREWMKGGEVFMHNAAFDTKFLNHEMEIMGVKEQLSDFCTISDTLKMARSLHPGKANNLNALAQRYRISVAHREFHGALIDAELLAKVYLAMTSGQITLFTDGEQEKTQTKATTIAGTLAEKLAASPIIHASDEEIALHERFFSA